MYHDSAAALMQLAAALEHRQLRYKPVAVQRGGYSAAKAHGFILFALIGVKATLFILAIAARIAPLPMSLLYAAVYI